VVVEHGSVAALGGAVGVIIWEPGAWRAPVVEAAARARELFAPARVAAQLHELYERVVARSKAADP
jgi:hypothetical protein